MSFSMEQAEQELDALTTLFNNVVEACHNKCIPPTYQDGELNKGEGVCIDRCVAKFFDVNVKIGQKLSNPTGASESSG